MHWSSKSTTSAFNSISIVERSGYHASSTWSLITCPNSAPETATCICSVQRSEMVSIIHSAFTPLTNLRLATTSKQHQADITPSSMSPKRKAWMMGSPALCFTLSCPTPYSTMQCSRDTHRSAVALCILDFCSLLCCPQYNSLRWAHARRPSLILATHHFLSAFFFEASVSPSSFQETDVHAGSSWQRRQVLCSSSIV